MSVVTFCIVRWVCAVSVNLLFYLFYAVSVVTMYVVYAVSVVTLCVVYGVSVVTLYVNLFTPCQL